MPTLHVRCGSDIEGELEAARFSGDFLAVWDSFPVGPVTDAPDWIAQRACFHAEPVPSAMRITGISRGAHGRRPPTRGNRQGYARVVIWTEHDSHDQLSLIRCLAHYARTGPPRVLELISVNHFPGSRRFIGLGQLPPEAMWLLGIGAKSSMLNGCQSAPLAWAALTSAASPRARGHRSNANAGAAASRTGRASPPAGAAVVGERPQPDAILALTETSQGARQRWRPMASLPG